MLSDSNTSPDLRHRDATSPASRRSFLRRAAAYGIVPVLATPLMARNAKQSPVLAYAGTYSSPQGPEGAKGRGSGICLLEMDPATGALSQRELFENDSNPSWLAFNPAKTHLFSANEISNYQGSASGSVSSYSVDRTSGRLKLVNTVSSEGAGPTHLSVHPSGKFIFVANYHGGTVSVIPVQPDGSLAKASDVKHDSGNLGPVHASSAPKGSFAISGHDRTHAHMIEPDPTGNFVVSTDLGTDQILVWKFDAEHGSFSASPQAVSVPPGDGPRHFAFHPNHRWFYCLQEEGSTIMLFDYDGTGGTLKSRQTVSTLPKEFAGTNFTSELRISADGRFVYCANRLHDTIAWFPIGPDGTLTLAGETWTRGDYPRSFTIDPSGNFLYSCNQRADAVAAFRVNRKTGALTFLNQYTPIGTPSIILFLA